MFEVLQRNRFLLKDTISQAVQITATSEPPAVPEPSSELSPGQALALGESFDPEEQARIQQMSHDCSRTSSSRTSNGWKAATPTTCEIQVVTPEVNNG